MKFQEEKRKETKERIDDAISILNDLGKKVTVAKLVEITGLSRATFYKDGIRQLWDKKYKTRKLEISNKLKDNKGLEKLLEEISKEKEQLYEKYIKALEKKEDLEERNKNLQEKFNEEKRNLLIQRLGEKGISTNVHFKPLPMFTLYKNLGYKIEDYPNAYAQYENEISLPVYSTLALEDAKYVAEELIKEVKEIL